MEAKSRTCRGFSPLMLNPDRNKSIERQTILFQTEAGVIRRYRREEKEETGRLRQDHPLQSSY